MNKINNPFVTSGYAGEKYFCDRIKETNDIVSLLTNGNNIALISPRRIGKTDLIRHCFAQKEIADNYYCFIIDIYSTLSVEDFIVKLGKSILDVLKPKGKQIYSKFLGFLKSLKTGISYDINGTPSWSVGVGDIVNPKITIDEIFEYLKNADKPCIVAIDEFQQILKYNEGNIEADLRTHIQYCSNAKFIFSGSQRHMMGEIFTSPNRPFYQSVTIISLPVIDKQKYLAFCLWHFRKSNKKIDVAVIDKLYDDFDGVTFYLQKVMNILYSWTDLKRKCSMEMYYEAIDYIVNFTAPVYLDYFTQLPEKQRQVLLAICKDGKADNVTSGEFSLRHNLVSPSSVASAVKGLLEKDLITSTGNVYQVYDKFFAIWMLKNEV
ncbi:MAG: ATP-binding protein [Bacteroidales bacterium]|nr:ATP-binding protein [Bacteroidales bacterium]